MTDLEFDQFRELERELVGVRDHHQTFRIEMIKALGWYDSKGLNLQSQHRIAEAVRDLARFREARYAVARLLAALRRDRRGEQEDPVSSAMREVETLLREED